MLSARKLGRRLMRGESFDQRHTREELARLAAMPRYQPTETSLLGVTLRLVDAASFVAAYRQIFEDEIYRVHTATQQPLFVDCGANIGLGIIYWKRLYPQARIIAFEPDPDVFSALVFNCNQLQLANVELVNKAVWNEAGKLSFYKEGADAGHLSPRATETAQLIDVATVRLRDYLDQPIDLLKLDIEGAEAEVLNDCRDKLNGVEQIFVEYHSFLGREQNLDQIFSVLKDNGFRIHVKSELVAERPFVDDYSYAGMDNSLNMFAYRETRSPLS